MQEKLLISPSININFNEKELNGNVKASEEEDDENSNENKEVTLDHIEKLQQLNFNDKRNRKLAKEIVRSII